MLRLVRDEPTNWTEMEEQDVPADSPAPAPRRGRFKRAAELIAASVDEPAEARDGAIEDTTEDESAESSATDMAVNIAAGHVSIVFGMRGPNFATSSACASSMLEEWLLAPIPRDSQRSRVSLLGSPSSRASS